jgi:hypothetical protein
MSPALRTSQRCRSPSALTRRCGKQTRARSIVAAVLAVTASGCAGLSGERTAGSHCFIEPTLYDWQRLDADEIVVWSLPEERAYHVTLAQELTDLRSADGLEFADGNNDGLLCSEGWDSLITARGRAISSPASATLGQSSRIYFVSRVNERAVDKLRLRHAATRGDRTRGVGAP